MKRKIVYYAVRIIPAAIMLQTLLFKFGIGGIDMLKVSQELFTKISIFVFGSPDYEAYGRISTGIIELIASALLLIPQTSWVGALIGLGTMLGAIVLHLTVLGVAMGEQGDPSLFIMAVVVLLCCLKVVYDNKKKIFSRLTYK